VLLNKKGIYKRYIKNDYDVIITGNKEVIDFFDGNDNVYTILIPNGTTDDCKSTEKYDSLNDVIKDNKLLEKLQEFVNNKNKN
jgi:predicted RND superfamily exporter protein